MRCQYLDINAKQCKRKAEFVCEYHGNYEIYHERSTPQWVKAYLCKKHAVGVNREEMNGK